jgi:hypothetical protein
MKTWMNKSRLSSTLMVVLLLAPSLRAAQKVPSVITSSANWGDNRGSRRTQAQEWLREVSELDNQIPTLSPAEAAWLRVEYDDEIARADGHYTPRAIRARHGKEGSARFAKPITKSMVAILEQLASSAPLEPRDETTLWCQLMSLALDLNFWADVETLGELGVLARDPKTKIGTPGWSTFQQALHQLWASRAESILDVVVLPYLASLRR